MKILELIDQLNDIFIRCGNLEVVKSEYVCKNECPIIGIEVINEKVHIQS